MDCVAPPSKGCATQSISSLSMRWPPLLSADMRPLDAVVVSKDNLTRALLSRCQSTLESIARCTVRLGWLSEMVKVSALHCCAVSDNPATSHHTTLSFLANRH